MIDTPKPAVSLASLMTPSKTVTINFPGYKDMTVDLCYLAREELVNLRKKCVTTKFSKKTRQPEEILDEDRFLLEYCKAVIKDWTGFKYQYLEELLLVDVAAFDPNDTLDFTPDNAELLMRNSGDFDTWVTETVSELENFTGNK
jgi:hypothetical protein